MQSNVQIGIATMWGKEAAHERTCCGTAHPAERSQKEPRTWLVVSSAGRYRRVVSSRASTILIQARASCSARATARWPGKDGRPGVRPTRPTPRAATGQDDERWPSTHRQRSGFALQQWAISSKRAPGVQGYRATYRIDCGMFLDSDHQNPRATGCKRELGTNADPGGKENKRGGCAAAITVGSLLRLVVVQELAGLPEPASAMSDDLRRCFSSARPRPAQRSAD